MKTCPNCGAKMGADVNFCTNCGTDLRGVSVDKPANSEPTMSRSEMKRNAANTQPVQQPVSQPTQPAPQQNVQQPNPQINAQPSVQQSVPQQNVQQPVMQQNVQQNNQQYKNSFQQAVQNFDAHNMWAWFVNSWKHPSQEQTAEKWYGWVTLLVEDVIIGLGLYIAAQRGASIFGSSFASSTSGFTFGVAIELMFFLALGELVLIGAVYLSYKIIYGHAKDFMEFSNHIVQTSNLNAIFIVLFFLFVLIFGVSGSFLGTFMLMLAYIVFEVALTIVVVGDANPVHDKFYGYLLFVLLQMIASMLFMTMAAGIIGTQIGSDITNLISNSQY